MSGKDKLRKFRENETFQCLIQAPSNTVINNDHPLKGHWNEKIFLNTNPVVLELGCGKGEYTIALAQKYPDRNFIGIDIKGARLWKGAKFATDNNLPNVAFLRTRIEFINSFFKEDEISSIWITFADPQPKKPNKRLTSPLFLEKYMKFLQPDGIINLKTDSQLLYNYSLQVATEGKMKILDCCADIYGSRRTETDGKNGAADGDILSIRTFYESQFLAKGIAITYLAFCPGKIITA